MSLMASAQQLLQVFDSLLGPEHFSDITLFACHLPLDAHPQLGNTVQFGPKLALQ